MSSAQPVSGHRGRDRWMCALAATSDLPTMAYRLALGLAVYFNCKTAQCDPSYPKLAETIAVSERSVFRAVAMLEKGGWIAVDRASGNRFRKNQFTLLVPERVTSEASSSGDIMMSPEASASGDNIVSPEAASAQVTENGPSGDKKRGDQVTHSVSAQKNLRTCEPEERAAHGAHTARAVRESATETNTSDDATPNQRALALVETVAAQQQPPSIASTQSKLGPVANASADPALAPVYQRGRDVLGADADAITAKLLDAYEGDVIDALDALSAAELDSDPREYIESDIEATLRRQGPVSEEQKT